MAALGEPDISQFTPDFWLEGREETEVQVYVCAPPGKYEYWFDERTNFHRVSDPLHESVFVGLFGDLESDGSSGVVRRFLLRESSGLLSVVVSSMNFAVVSPPGMDWRSTTMRTLYDDAAAGEQSACDRAALEHHGKLCPGTWSHAVCEGKSPSELGHQILLLVDAPVDDVAGYANYGGIARVSLHAASGRLGSDDFALIVAHELGHSLLHLQHTDEADGASCYEDQWALMRSNSRCLSPPMGPNGLLDYEITCPERRLLGWRCEHEPVSDEWLNFMDRRLTDPGEVLLDLLGDASEDMDGGTYSCGLQLEIFLVSGMLLDGMREYLTIWDQWPEDYRFWGGGDDHAANKQRFEGHVRAIANQNALAARLFDRCVNELDPSR